LGQPPTEMASIGIRRKQSLRPHDDGRSRCARAKADQGIQPHWM